MTDPRLGDVNARLMSWRTLMTYFVLSRNGEKSLNKFLSPDPDYLRGPSHGCNTSCVKKISSIGEIIFELRGQVCRQTDKQTQMHKPYTPLLERGLLVLYSFTGKLRV